MNKTDRKVASLYYSVLGAVLIGVATLGIGYMNSVEPVRAQPKGAQTNPQPTGSYWRGTDGYWVPVTPDTPMPVDATVSVDASIAPFAPVTTGTPITATTGGATGTLPAGVVVVATNVGTTNAAFCKLGASATVNDSYLAPNGGWFAFTVGAATQLTCITSTSTTTINTTGGSGLPAGSGGGAAGGGGGGAVTQSGTWTMQPGNTANTTPWLQVVRDAAGNARGANVNASNQLAIAGPVTVVSGGIASGAIASGAVASGAYATGAFATGALSSGSVASGAFASGSLAAGSMVDFLTVRGTVAGGTAAANSLLAGAIFNSTPITVTNGQGAALQSDANGFLKVNVAAGGAAGGTSSNFAAAFPSVGTAAGMSQGGNMVALTGTSGNLNVQCANCSGSGVSTVDAATFTASTSLFAGGGGFFQTTATSNALTNGQQGMFQVTANRAIFSNLRNAAGAEVGVTGAELFVGGRGTAGTATGGVLTVQGVAAMTPLLATLSGTNNIATVTTVSTVTTLSTLTGGGVANNAADSGNPIKIGGVFNSSPITLDNGDRGDAQLDVNGYLKVNVASATGLAQGSTTSGQTGSLVMGAVTTAAPTYTTAQTSPFSLTTAGDLRTVISNATVAVTQSGTWTVQPGNTANTTPWLVTVASATTPVSTMNSASANAGVNSAMAAVFDDATPTTITENNFGTVRMSANRNLYGTIRDAAGNERGANVNASNQLSVTGPVTVGALATGGSTTVGNIAANNTTAVVVKASAGTLYGIQVYGLGAAPAYLKIYNATTATCGSGTPVKRIMIPAASTAANGAGSNVTFGTVGVAFGTGITYCVTTGITDADTTAPAASTFLINVDYL